jgi:tryptophanyl-tRNA synthetase
MSKSYGNAIYLSDSAGVTEKTVQKMITDPLKIKKNDPGRPEVCNVFTYHTIFSGKEEVQQVDRDCRSGALGCVDCKAWMAKNLNSYLEPIRKRAEFGKPPKLDKILLEAPLRLVSSRRRHWAKSRRMKWSPIIIYNILSFLSSLTILFFFFF